MNRDTEAVRRDVRDGVMSRETAEEIFGVIVSEGTDPVVDVKASERIRRKARPPSEEIDPPTANAARWVERLLRPRDSYELNPRL
jgi:N-methylhydantoinase B